MSAPIVHDLAVVGGGPVGLATAIAARQRGLAAVVLERGAGPGRDKACGEGLMPEAVAALAELGLGVERLGGVRLHGIRYLVGERSAEGLFPHGGNGLGVRRTALHAALSARAAEVGVELRYSTKAIGFSVGGVATAEGEEIRARTVVGADGLHSDVRRWAQLAAAPAERRRFGVRRHYALAPWSDLVEVHWGVGAEAYVTPVGEREVGVALLWSGGPSSFDSLLERFPRLAARLAGAAASSRDLGAGPFEQRVRAVVGERVALVGDAAGYLDAITGEGLALGFGQARDLAAALAAGDLAAYARAHRARARRPLRITRLALVAARHPALARRAVAALGADPALFSQLLGLLASTTRPAPRGFVVLARLVAALARA